MVIVKAETRDSRAGPTSACGGAIMSYLDMSLFDP